MKITVKLIVFSMLLTAVACGGEGGRRTAGIRCPFSYNPVDMNPKNSQAKVDAKANDYTELPAGNYKYAGASLYYVDRATDAKILLGDGRKGAKDSEEFSPKVACVRNYLKLQKGGALTVSASGVSDLVIDENHKMTSFEVRDYGFTIQNGRRSDAFKKADSKPGSFKEVYDKTAAEAFLIKMNDTTYQIRSYYPGSKNRGDLYLLISLTYSKPSP